MKVTSLKLSSRKDYSQRKNTSKALYEKNAEYWVTNGYEGYSYKLRRTKSACLMNQNNDTPRLTVTNLGIDELPQFTNGLPSEKWAKKTPRLRSSKCKRIHQTGNSCPYVEEEDNMTYFDFRNALNNSDESKSDQNKTEDEDRKEDYIVNTIVPEDKIYEVSSDIEKLIFETQQADVCNTNEENKTKRKIKKLEDKSKRKCKKNRKNKTIKLSISRPPSPETEQVIRVDVTTNVCFEDFEEIKAGYDSNDVKNCRHVKSRKSVGENELYRQNGNNEIMKVRGIPLSIRRT